MPNRNLTTMRPGDLSDAGINRRKVYDDAEYCDFLEAHHLNYLRRKIDGAMKAFKKGGSCSLVETWLGWQ